MMTSYMSYKRHVAPLYRSELDRRLFATASGKGRKKQREQAKKARAEKNRREWLRGRWLKRTRLKSDPESTAA
ncbi:MAG: hypothetical protein GWN99_15595 [Gemmatimonadetes bacterium]|uniref:Uncharacterized protein n=1 Tax=Candidatus Kutchimonas denitrificans TaxID=3056748 RepID=A0AAE5CAU6_9BACT|nr:hypothetical protein [Gemmatimonadota bacterium]NIR73728.1 hypothetical protein [Candidatus Kutchimonas denitrificans]NIS02468.1 hypothetical protein [Gemmatimonadota bacterium]NIT67458.1 hypothetical protein [Gemmatimonadota bacterium]NIU51590.1 hypothetical protein [Gemmatimonadota bacterium]